MLTAAAIVPVIGIVGSAVDIGRAYKTQLRLQQACDAGVLAGRRAMGGATYSDAAEAEADKMFNFNFPEAKYGASDRKSVVSGKSVSVRVDLGGRRIIKKKPTTTLQTNTTHPMSTHDTNHTSLTSNYPT